MSLALLFPGQGTQHPAMLEWLDTRPEAAGTLALMAAELGSDWRTHLGDEDWSSRNRVAQWLLTGVCVGAWQSVAGLLPAPSVVAGYSIGELPAFYAAGVFDAGAALELARQRAEAMELTVAGIDTGLLAITGVGTDAVERACLRHGLAIAIELAADRRVLGGRGADLDRAAIELTQSGAQCRRLAVRLASHTPWMAGAVTDFAQRAKSVAFAIPRAALVCNFTGAVVRRPEELRTSLSGQLARAVPWARCMEAVAERRPRCVLEVGPGSSLSKLWNERFPAIPSRSVDEFRGPDAVASWVAGVIDR